MSLPRSAILLAATLALSASLSTAQQGPGSQTSGGSPTQAESSCESGSQKDADKTASAASTHEKDSQDPKERKTHVRLGTIIVGASYTHFSGSRNYGYPYDGFPYWDGLYPYYAWSPWWGASAPFYGPGYFSRGDGRGEVRLSADSKKASVYLDGGYAGTADQLKSMWLDPGAYDLSLTADGKSFKQRIYVLSGKTVKIVAKLEAREQEVKP
jgi:hypothetical protein